MLDLFFRLFVLGDITDRGEDITGFAVIIFLRNAFELRMERRAVFSLQPDFTGLVALFLKDFFAVFQKNLSVRRFRDETDKGPS